MENKLTFSNISQAIKDVFNFNNWVQGIKTHAPNISAETLGWLAVVVLHLATIPTMAAVLTGLTEKMPPVDLVLFTWTGLFLLFCKATIQRDLLNIVTIGLGFFIQASLLALIVFK
jgi:phage-related minor tail protein